MKKLNRKQKYLLLRSMIILLVLLVVNTFAWFLMNTKSSLSMNVHIDSWQITFKDDNNVESQNFEIVIDRAYPGMPDYTKVFTITNTGERDAELQYSVIKARLLDETYEASDTGTTHEEIENMLMNDLPFYFTFEFSDTDLGHTTGNNSETFTVTMHWDYESENPSLIAAKDELDTAWGENVYDYYVAHSNDTAPTNTMQDDTRYPIYLKINIVASQAQ